MFQIEISYYERKRTNSTKQQYRSFISNLYNQNEDYRNVFKVINGESHANEEKFKLDSNNSEQIEKKTENIL